jgi:hypothetical protein
MLIPWGAFAGDIIKATGGVITIADGFVYHTFKTSSSFTPLTTLLCDYLAIGGGGAAAAEAGGGAGGYRLVTSQTFSSAFNIVIGAGGDGANWPDFPNAVNGQDTTNGAGTIFAYGGGRGNASGSSPLASITQASGGGGGFSQTGTTNSGGFGNNGGNGSSNGAGGGGGAGNAGGSGSGSIGGNGGSGVLNTVWANATSTGVSGYYAGGGAGYGVDSSGTGGLGGGGSYANDGVANTGGGGGSRLNAGGFSKGGSGLMIIRYAA